MSQHHPSCQPSDRDLVWLCAQCGGHESAEYILDEKKALVDALEPLAKIGRIFSVEPYAKGYPDEMRLVDNDTVRQHNFITIGDCRKADALAKSSRDAKTDRASA